MRIRHHVGSCLAVVALIASVSIGQEPALPGDEFQINSYTTGRQLFPSVAADAAGNFVVVWDSNGSYGTDTSDWSIQSQRYEANGTPLGGQFQINSYATYSHTFPALAEDTAGNFVVVWDCDGSYGTDTSSESIQGRQYLWHIYDDGFESGDTSAWSSTVQ